MMRDRTDDPRLPSRVEIEAHIQEEQTFRLDALMENLAEIDAEDRPAVSAPPIGWWVVSTMDNPQCPYQAEYFTDWNDPDLPSTWLEMPPAEPFGQWMARRKHEGSAHLVRGDLRWLAYCGLTTPLTHPATDGTHRRCNRCVSELMRLSAELREIRL
jgi:hypothetical protein